MKSTAIALSLIVGSFPVLSEAGRKIRFCDLPRCAQEAVCRVAPGIRVDEVEVERDNGWTFFEVEGECAYYEYEIEVTPRGQILKIDRDKR